MYGINKLQKLQNTLDLYANMRPFDKLSLSFLRSREPTEKVNVKTLEELRRSKIELEEMKKHVAKIQEKNRDLKNEILELVKKEQWEKKNRGSVELELIKEREQRKKEKDQWEKEKQNLIEENEQREKKKRRLLEEKEQREKEKRKLIEEKEPREKEKRKLIEEKEQSEKEKRKLIEEKEQCEKEKRKLTEEKEHCEKEKRKLIEEKEHCEKEKRKLTEEKEQREKEKRKLIEEKEQWEKGKKDLKKDNKQWEQWKNEKQNMEKHIETLEQHEKTQKKNFTQNLQEVQEAYKKKIDALTQRLDEKGNGLRELEEKNAELRREASKYQSALGIATNVRLGDDDQNHSVQLKRDIENLQSALENYVTHLKPNMNIDVEKVRAAAKGYNCKNEVTEKNLDKSFIKAILQRITLDMVLSYRSQLFKHQGKYYALESDIELRTRDLLEPINTLLKSRCGNDKVTDATMIKIRQQVYGILGNRGFNDIIRNDQTYIHNLIQHISEKLNEMMNGYRKINDVNMRNRVESMAPKLVRDICKLFWFRVNVQEPPLEYFFFPENVIIDQNMMEGKWNDDETNQLHVDICYFPMFGSSLQFPDRKIHTPARVFPQKN
ncbi:13092_t:CDS:1 [Acaulospora morrowiae]|uniref:13092_t:CDS:1 n=1 Tax=Acaulospora morrowiae TaxID=94023 RepID=A0A9N9FR59_9GLOM|nr:13092_t:CDS:1 [Acaulospora morrowiae]